MPRKKSNEPKIGALKKELRELRLKECPPITKMKKAEVKVELLRLRGDKFMEKTSLPEETIDKLKAVEAETKERNVARKEEAEKVVEAVSTLQKKVRGRKSASKAMEGLKKVEPESKLEKERKELIENAEKMRMEGMKKNKEDIEKISKIIKLPAKVLKIRKAIYDVFPEKTKEGLLKGLKKHKSDMSIDDFIKSERFGDLLEQRNKMRRATIKGSLELTPDEVKEDKLFENLAKDNESVASASDVEEKPKGAKRRKNYVPKRIEPAPKPVKEKAKRGRKAKAVEAPKVEISTEEKKKRFAKGSAEAKAYMASLRAKKGK